MILYEKSIFFLRLSFSCLKLPAQGQPKPAAPVFPSGLSSTCLFEFGFFVIKSLPRVHTAHLPRAVHSIVWSYIYIFPLPPAIFIHDFQRSPLSRPPYAHASSSSFSLPSFVVRSFVHSCDNPPSLRRHFAFF